MIIARADSNSRADQLIAIYQELASTHCPVIVHHRLSKKKRLDALNAIKERTSRIVVCVDMLGEGFDLPELKIAALHDMHKSLAITLQFTGRFARARSDLGHATMVANIARPEVD